LALKGPWANSIILNYLPGPSLGIKKFFKTLGGISQEGPNSFSYSF